MSGRISPKNILGINIREFNSLGYRKNHKIIRGEYRSLFVPDHHRADKRGYVLEHIAVWENANGKQLPVGHNVHHLNGIKTDNRPQNLVAVTPKEHHTLRIPYQKRIRELEDEVERLKQIGLPMITPT